MRGRGLCAAVASFAAAEHRSDDSIGIKLEILGETTGVGVCEYIASHECGDKIRSENSDPCFAAANDSLL